MEADSVNQLWDISFMSGICIAFLIIGVTIGMFAERAHRWRNKKVSLQFDANATLSEQQKEILSKKPEKVPKHIAVIMDGNRRYGREAHSDALQGHWAGGQTLVDFCQWCMADGVEIATVYAFSTENWNREPLEVTTLMTIFAKYAETFQKEALAKNVRVNVLSTDFDKLPVKVQQSVNELQSSTAACTGFTVNICLSYGSRGDILQSCQQIARKVKEGEMAVEEVNEKVFGNHLATAGQPDPDILIRTSGEYRLSNFLLWQLAYTELFFVDKYWPQLTQMDVRLIMHQYSNRNRRFGV